MAYSKGMHYCMLYSAAIFSFFSVTMEPSSKSYNGYTGKIFTVSCVTFVNKNVVIQCKILFTKDVK